MVTPRETWGSKRVSYLIIIPIFLPTILVTKTKKSQKSKIFGFFLFKKYDIFCYIFIVLWLILHHHKNQELHL